jgi:hypothetical protein
MSRGKIVRIDPDADRRFREFQIELERQYGRSVSYVEATRVYVQENKNSKRLTTGLFS